MEMSPGADRGTVAARFGGGGARARNSPGIRRRSFSCLVSRSEAVRLLPSPRTAVRATCVHTRLACQAALSARVFDNTTPPMPGNATPVFPTTPNICGYYWQPGAPVSPDTWQNENRPSYMDTQYMPADTRFVNHYNPNDFALGGGFGWQTDQRHKPDAGYSYGHLNSTTDPLRFMHNLPGSQGTANQ